MSSLIIGMILLVSLLLVSALALTARKPMRNAPGDMHRSVHAGVLMVATITDVHVQQDWKEAARGEHSSWTGNLERQTTGQTCYEVTAQGMHAQTEQRYTFRRTIWSDEGVKKPTVGESVLVVVDLHDPRRYCLDVRSFS